MVWKNLPNWLKGGIIALGITGINVFIQAILLFTDPHLIKFNILNNFIKILLYVPDKIGASILAFLMGSSNNFFQLLYLILVMFIGIVNFIVLFLIGALIGWIYGKIKNK